MSAIANAAHDEAHLHRALEHLPAGAYTCDPTGRITYFNQHALVMWGRAPKLHDEGDRFCGSFKLFSAATNEPISHADCWMALALREQREFLGREIVVERPDGSRVTVLAYATPVFDDFGTLVCAINILVNITERKRFESLLARANRDNDLYRAALADALREELEPMHSALGALRVAMQRRTSEADEYVDVLRMQLGRVEALVDELVDVRERDGVVQAADAIHSEAA